MKAYNRLGKRIELQNILGTGGEGTVYRVTAKTCAKIYTKPSAFKEAKIKTMIAKPPVPLTNPKCRNGRVAWPTDLLYDRPGGKFVGYLMPLIEIRNYQESEVVFIEKLRTKKFGQRFTYEHLMTAAYNFAMTVHYIHQAGHSVGDLREKNILVDQNGQVCLVDCDSFQIMDTAKKRFFASETYTPGYLAPEWIGRDLSKANRRENDHFALAVWLFQMLMNGMHPYQARGGKAEGCPSLEEKIKMGTYPYTRGRGLKPPVAAPDYTQVPVGLRSLFEAAFVRGQTDPTKRPEALVYANQLKREVGRLKTCRRNRLHRFSGDLVSCPFCSRTTPKPVKSSTNRPMPVTPNRMTHNRARPARPQTRRARPAIALPKFTRAALAILLIYSLLLKLTENTGPIVYGGDEVAAAPYEETVAPAPLTMADFGLWYSGGVLYVNQWGEPHFKEALRINGEVRASGIGTYIPPDLADDGNHMMAVELTADRAGTADLVFGAETWWCYSPDFGTYRLRFFVNEDLVVDSGWMTYKETGAFQLDLRQGDVIAILIQEKAGAKGTLNPVIAFENGE